MNDKLFDTDDKQKNAIAMFQDLQKHPGWLLFLAVIEENISLLTRRLQIEQFETIDDMRAVQRTRQAYEDAKNTPQMIIEAYSRDQSENAPHVDPFQSIEEFREEQERIAKT